MNCSLLIFTCVIVGTLGIVCHLEELCKNVTCPPKIQCDTGTEWGRPPGCCCCERCIEVIPENGTCPLHHIYILKRIPYYYCATGLNCVNGTCQKIVDKSGAVAINIPG